MEDGNAMNNRGKGKTTVIKENSPSSDSNVLQPNNNPKYVGWDDEKEFDYEDVNQLEINNEKAQLEKACKGSVDFFNKLQSKRKSLAEENEGIYPNFEEYNDQLNNFSKAIDKIKNNDYQGNMRNKVSDIYAMNNDGGLVDNQTIMGYTSSATNFSKAIHDYSDLLFTIDKKTNQKTLKGGQLHTVITTIKNYIQKETNDIAVQRKQLEYREGVLNTLQKVFNEIKEDNQSGEIIKQYQNFTQNRDMFFNTINTARQLNNDYNTLLNEANKFQQSMTAGDDKLDSEIQGMYSNTTSYGEGQNLQFNQENIMNKFNSNENNETSSGTPNTQQNASNYQSSMGPITEETPKIPEKKQDNG
ncbi:MAG: hypothetical protein IJ848_03555, partial [Alphaproteobacteria bacterium]|nr:hypothetical protein [Alphaproteobacteria bacterium]